MNKLLVVCLLFFSLNAYAERLQSTDSKLIKAAGIPLHPKAVFGNGSREIGFRFAINLSPQAAQAWYRKQLPKWPLYNKYGNWMLYDSAPDKDTGDVMSMNHISIQQNDNLPQWFSLDKNMTTEITIILAK